jgi:hypothetical protein
VQRCGIVGEEVAKAMSYGEKELKAFQAGEIHISKGSNNCLDDRFFVVSF